MTPRHLAGAALLAIACRTARPTDPSPVVTTRAPDREALAVTTSAPASLSVSELVFTLDRDADILHADITPSVIALSERGVTGALAVLPSLDSDDATTRLHAQRVFERVIERAHGFRAGRGFPTPDDDASAGRETRAIGYSHDASTADRRAAIERLRAWTRSQPWQLIAEGDSLRVEAERARYSRDATTGYCVRVRVTNLGDTALGLDLRELSHTVYANQWGYSRKAWREAIDERRVVRHPLDDDDRAALRSAFARGELTPLPAHGSAEYLRCIDAPLDRAQPEGAPFFIAALDGEVRATDGARATQLIVDDAWRELAMVPPVELRALPAGVRAIGP